MLVLKTSAITLWFCLPELEPYWKAIMGILYFLNAIYTLIEHTHISTTNSKQSVIKHQSQDRVKKSKKTCLQPLLVKSYVAKVLPFHFFWHSLLLILLLFPSFSHVIVQWVSFQFFIVLIYHLLWWSQLFVPCWVVTFLCFKGFCLIAKSWAVSSFRMRYEFRHSQKLEFFGIGYTLCVPKIIINTATCFAFDCPIQIELLCLTQDNNEEKQ